METRDLLEDVRLELEAATEATLEGRIRQNGLGRMQCVVLGADRTELGDVTTLHRNVGNVVTSRHRIGAPCQRISHCPSGPRIHRTTSTSRSKSRTPDPA